MKVAKNCSCEQLRDFKVLTTIVTLVAIALGFMWAKQLDPLKVTKRSF
jgi:hypothetical protein